MTSQLWCWEKGPTRQMCSLWGWKQKSTIEWLLLFLYEGSLGSGLWFSFFLLSGLFQGCNPDFFLCSPKCETLLSRILIKWKFFFLIPYFVLIFLLIFLFWTVLFLLVLMISRNTIRMKPSKKLTESWANLKKKKRKKKPNSNDMEAVNLGDANDIREAKISVHIEPNIREELIKALIEFKNVLHGHTTTCRV